MKLTNCTTYRQLPEPLQEECVKNPHLLRYLHGLPLDEIGIPQYYAKLERSLKSVKNRNLLYPVSDNIYIHILVNTEDIRDHYIPVEVNLFDEYDSLLERVEEELADSVEAFEGIKDDTERIEVVLRLVGELVDVRSSSNGKLARNNGSGGSSIPHKDIGKGKEKSASASAKFRSLRTQLLLKYKEKTQGAVKEKLTVTNNQLDGIRYLIRRKLEGMGILQPLIHDTNIEDISCSGLGKIFVEHKIFGGLTTVIGFGEHEELDKFVVQLAESIKHPVTFRDPTADATLSDGSRINIVYGTDVSKRGSNFTIRKFSPVPISIIELIQYNSLSYEMAAYLSVIIQEGMNIFL